MSDHNPSTCTREPCRRCAGPHEPPVPKVAPNPHQARTLEPPKPRIDGLTLQELGDLAIEFGHMVKRDGEATWRHLHDWENAPRVDTTERGGGNGGTGSAEAHRDRLTDRRLARYFAEYVDLLTNLVAPLRRVERLHDIAQVEDRTVHRTRSGDLDPMLAAEAAASGYCASCWRYEQTCFDRETDAEGHYYDRNHCRRCARFKNEHGIVPPVDLLRIWHGLGRRTWTQAEVDAALAKQRQRKAS